MRNTESVCLNVSYKSFKTYNFAMRNSCCDRRNFGSVKPVFHLANLFARTSKKRMWLAGDVVSVSRQPIKFLFACSREQIRQVENWFKFKAALT